MKAAFALIIAPLLAAALLAAAYEGWLANMGTAPDDFFNVWITFAVILAGASLTLGLAIHVSLHHLQRATLIFYLLAAGIAGAILSSLFMDKIHHTAFHMSVLDMPQRVLIIALGTGPAVLTAAIFWLIRRPDRATTTSVIPDTPQA